MALGSLVRNLFGPYERHVADAYRAIFIDLDAWIEIIARWAPAPTRILEVGCGEGAMTERLARRFPDARVTAIDVTPRLGRLYCGDRTRVRFIETPVERIAAAEPHAFDLVILSDVIHHVPSAARSSLLRGVADALASGGAFIFKDWMRSRAPIHWMCEASDRYLTGDDVSYLNEAEARVLIAATFGAEAVQDAQTVRPWANNAAMLLRAA